MTTSIDIQFQGGMKIAADCGDFLIPTDQSVKEGGQGSAPTPFDLFLASLATCAGTYALRFCQTRKIDSEGLAIRAVCEYAQKGFKVTKITFEVTTPDGFPEKYKQALLRAIDLCTVKKHVLDPPEFAIDLR